MVEYTVLIVGTPIALILMWRFYYSNLARARRFEHYRDRFNDASDNLKINEVTPKEVLEVLASIKNMMSSASEARQFFYFYGSNAAKHGGNVRAKLLQEIVREHSSLGSHFLEAMSTGLLALTYMSNFWGSDAREMLAKPERASSQMLFIVEILERMGKLR